MLLPGTAIGRMSRDVQYVGAPVEGRLAARCRGEKRVSGRGAAAYALATSVVRSAPIETEAIEGGVPLSARHPFAGLVAIGLLLSACSASATPPPSAAPTPAAPSAASIAPASASPSPSPSPSPSASPSPKPTPTPAPTPTPVPTPVAFALDATVWWSGYAIHVAGGTYDPAKHKLNIDASFENTSTIQTEVSQVSNGVKIVWNGQFLPGYVTPGPVPVGATAKAQIQLQPPADFTVDGAVLTFGAPDEHQAIVPLNGDPASSDTPVDLVVSGKVKMGAYASFTVNRGVLVPASCSGYSDRIKFGPLKKNELSIVLWGIATNTEPRNDALIDQGFLLVPDRTTSASNPVVSIYLPAKGTIRTDGMCFDVPAPGSGSYKLTMHESRSKANGSMTFVLP